MAGASIKVEMKGFEPVIRYLGRLSVPRYMDLAEMAGVELKKLSREAFAKQQDPVDGSKWEDSASAVSDGRNTLRDTGALAGSVSHATSQGVVEVGSYLVYARIHQEGGEAGRNKSVTLPRRRYLGHDAQWPKRFMDMPEVREMFE